MNTMEHGSRPGPRVAGDRALADSAQPGDNQAVDRALYATAAMTGLRQGELIALRWRGVDWKAARVRVRQNYVLGEFGTPKSKRSCRWRTRSPEGCASWRGRRFTARGSGTLIG